MSIHILSLAPKFYVCKFKNRMVKGHVFITVSVLPGNKYLYSNTDNKMCTRGVVFEVSTITISFSVTAEGKESHSSDSNSQRFALLQCLHEEDKSENLS